MWLLALASAVGIMTASVNLQYGVTHTKPDAVLQSLKRGQVIEAAEHLWDIVYPRPQTWPAMKEAFKTAQVSTAPGRVLEHEERQMIELVNQERRKAGLRPLVVDTRLVELARKKSCDMAVNGYFSHKSQRYGYPEQMVDKAGIPNKGVGENIAVSFTVENAHTALMDSPGHRANILDPRYTHFGVGIVVAGDGDRLLVTQLFIISK